MTYKVCCLALIFCSSLHFSCNPQTNNKDKNEKSVDYSYQNIDSGDTITRDIPLDKHGRFYRIYYRTLQFDSVANLIQLQNGFRDTCIRIVFANMGNTDQVAEFKNTDGNWKGTFYSMTFEDNDSGFARLVNRDIDTQNPKSGWVNFISKILYLGIATLPDKSMIPNYQLFTGGDGITTEIATSNFYKIYFYSNIDKNQHIKQAVQLGKVIELIEQEFDFKRLGE